MKIFSLVAMGVFLFAGTIVSRAENLTRISNETGVSVDTLQSERTSTGLGWGELEKAHLLANASGTSFDNIVAAHASHGHRSPVGPAHVTGASAMNRAALAMLCLGVLRV